MSKLPDPARRLAELFPLVERAFTKWAEAQMEGTGLSPARVRLMSVLHCEGPQTMGALGERLGVTPRNITTLIDALEGDGSVRRQPHPTDRRATVVELTPAGREAVERYFGPFVESLSGLFNELPAADRRELVRLLEAVAGLLQRRTCPTGDGTQSSGDS